GGTIRVESEFGVGSTFSVTIPTQPVAIFIEAEVPVEETTASNGKTGPLEDMAPRTIIVVEDNVDMVNFYRRHLSNDGYDVIGVITAADATNKLMQVQPAAVIVNVNINNDGGWDILSQITELEFARQVPIIVSSLHEDAERSQSFGVAQHLVRPFSPEDLLVAIQEAEENRISS
ncbi:MAG TPA: response regulator, partial [Aggregatilineales bacterium]|nr:response regulator [Aggregatilineales bacterium]